VIRKLVPTIKAISLIRIPTDTVGSTSSEGRSGCAGATEGAVSPSGVLANASCTGGGSKAGGGGGELGCADSIQDGCSTALGASHISRAPLSDCFKMPQ
jgi:hypothetical protein